MDARDVVITGIGAVTPLGIGREVTWEALCAGRSGVGPVTHFDASRLPTRIAAEVRGLEPGDFLNRKQARRAARFSQFAIVAAREAVADAKFEVHPDNSARVGVVINAGVAGFDVIEAGTRGMLAADPVDPGSYFVPAALTSMPACEVAIDLGVHGPVTASAVACASGVYALLEAKRLIRSGDADVALCGGTDSGITESMFASLVGMGALSRRNDDPQGASRPFSADRDGFVYGEGSVVLVVESAEHVARRGVTPYAVVAGGALTCDAFHVTAPSPGGTYAAAAITGALRDSRIAPEEVDLICAHGTSTPANDVTETVAIRTALGAAADDLVVTAPKSMTGHMIGAAGALGALVCALAIRDGVVPPTLNLHVPDPECDLDYVPHRARRMPVRVAATNAFGFGGMNCVAVLRATD